MVVITGLFESLSDAGKRIIRFGTTDTLLMVEAASSARRAQCPRCAHMAAPAGMAGTGASPAPGPVWAERSV